MSATKQVPLTWQSSRQRLHLPYLLVEGDDPAWTASQLMAFWKEGFNPAFCSGPSADSACPLQQGDQCPLVQKADIVLHLLDPSLGIATAIKSVRPELPVLVPAKHGHATVEAQAETLRQALRSGVRWKKSVGGLGVSLD